MNFVLGSAIDFSGVSLPFTVGDLVGSGSALLGLVGAFILLGLAFAFVPQLIRLINGSLRERGIERDEHGNRVHFRTKAEKEHFENFKKEKGWK